MVWRAGLGSAAEAQQKEAQSLLQLIVNTILGLST